MLTAAAVSVLAFRLPHGHILSWPQLLTYVAEQIFAVSIICAATVAVLSPAVLQKNRLEFLQLVRRGSIAALWLAPFGLFFQQNSFWTVSIAAILAIVITSSFSGLDHNSQNSESTFLTSMRVDTLPLTTEFGLQISVFAALCAQVGILASLGDHNAIGAMLIGLSFAVWTWVFHKAEKSSKSISGSRTVLTILMVASLLIVGLLPYLQNSGGSLAAHRGLFPHRGSGGNAKQPPSYASAEIGIRPAGSEGDQGIILWGEPQTYTKLVAPTPISEAADSSGNANPLILPFNGVYWFFKAPDHQPPAGSRQAHASPDVVEIRSTDRRRLTIEAHDHLANLIELDCCSRIQIAIRNADRYPDTVAVELVLVNTSLPHNPSVSLGRMMVNATHRWNIYEKPAPVAETLTFQIPPRTLLRSFDKVKIVFLLDRARADAAAKIAIDHFVLVPRGL